MCGPEMPEMDIGMHGGAGTMSGSATDVEVVQALLTQIGVLFDKASGLDLRSLDAEAVDEWVIGLQPLRARFDALLCRAASEADNAGIAPRRGLWSAASAIAADARCAPKVIHADVKLGWWLTTHSTIGDGFAAGRMTRAHVDVLRSATNPRTRDRMIESQDFFCDLASRLDFRSFCHAVGYWKNAADPDGVEPREQVAKRSHTWKILDDGSVTGTYRFDPLAGKTFRTLLEREIDRLRIHDADAGIDCTPAQRAADALVALVARGAFAKGMAAPLCHFVMSHGVAADLTARLLGDETGDDLPVAWDDIDARCEFADGTPLHPHFAMALLATATLRRLVLGAGGEILDLGRAVHGFPAQLRQAVVARARGRCEHVSGCDNPANWLQADHLIPWARGGTTATDNAQAACRPHNLQKRDNMHEEAPSDASARDRGAAR